MIFTASAANASFTWIGRGRFRILFISQLNGAESLISDALNEAMPLSVSTLAHRFGVADMLESEKSIEPLLALLYDWGFLTLVGRNENGKLLLQIPNFTVRRFYTDLAASPQLSPQLVN